MIKELIQPLLDVFGFTLTEIMLFMIVISIYAKLDTNKRMEGLKNGKKENH